MHGLIPVWIIGGPFIGLLILAFSFKGPSAMGGPGPRLPPRGRDEYDRSPPPVDATYAGAPRRMG